MENLKKVNHNLLKKWYIEDNSVYEIGVDEAGRGPLFGRVYYYAKNKKTKNN